MIELILTLMGHPADAYDHVDRPRRARPTVRDRLHQAAHRTGLAAEIPGLRGLAATIEWYRGHEDRWSSAKDATEAFYARRGSDRMEYGKPLRQHNSDPRPAAGRAAGCMATNRGWFKENWQREDGGCRAARFRARAEQHVVQRCRRNHPRHPRRTVGQVHLGRRGPHLRGLGRSARRPLVRHGLHRRARPSWAVFVLAASATPSRPWNPTPPTPTWSTTTTPDALYTSVNVADTTRSTGSIALETAELSPRTAHIRG